MGNTDASESCPSNCRIEDEVNIKSTWPTQGRFGNSGAETVSCFQGASSSPETRDGMFALGIVYKGQLITCPPNVKINHLRAKLFKLFGQKRTQSVV